MTIIAWDGHTLAADKRCSGGACTFTVRKIHRLADGSLIGLSGDSAYCAQMLAWVQAGEKAADIPATQRDRDKFAAAMVIRPNGEVWKYEDTPHPYRVEDKVFAIGSGRDFALAAMDLGLNSVRAVEVACARDQNCGNGIDTLRLEPAT